MPNSAPSVRGEAVEHEPAIAGLEDPQRHELAREHHVAEREHREAHGQPGPRSAADGPEGYDASTLPSASHTGRLTLWSATFWLGLLRISENSITPPPSTGT